MRGCFKKPASLQELKKALGKGSAKDLERAREVVRRVPSDELSARMDQAFTGAGVLAANVREFWFIRRELVRRESREKWLFAVVVALISAFSAAMFGFASAWLQHCLGWR